MEYYLKLKPSAQKELDKLPAKDQARIRLALARLRQDPFLGKKLTGEYDGFYSLRAWLYRIIYYIYRQQLLVFVIRTGHRQSVYK